MALYAEDRIEDLELEVRELQEEVREAYKEGYAAGYDDGYRVAESELTAYSEGAYDYNG